MMHIDLSPEALLDLKNLKGTIAANFGDDLAEKVLNKISNSIENLGLFPNVGIDVAAKYSVPCNYKCLITNKNYVFFRIEGDTIHIVRVLNERQDFMRILFDTKTTSPESEDL